MLKVLILRAPGTNCDIETKNCVEHFGITADIIHINKLLRKEILLEDYHALIIPGGFSYGDRVRSGAILGKILREKLKNEIKSFIREEKPILGICNGFQVILEAGLIEDVTLLRNVSNRYECRWIYLKVLSKKTIFTKNLYNKILYMPVAHSEGRVYMDKDTYERLESNDQIVLKYCNREGKLAGGEYPYNPNGSYKDVAGICDESGLIFGLMPHPERAFYYYQYPDWTRNRRVLGDGYKIFEGMIEYIKRKF